MNKVVLIVGGILALVITFFVVQQRTDIDESTSSEKPISYQNITTDELTVRLENKDFTLIDVHIPEQVHIPETDAFIPFDEVDRLAAALPDKNAPVVLYCRSGNMSARAARDLVARGYTNITNVIGGMNAWNAEGRPTTPIGSVN